MADAWVYTHGPAVRRIPEPLRKRAVSQAAIPTLEGARCWRFSGPEVVNPRRPRIVGCPSTLSPLAIRRHRLPAPFLVELPEVDLVGRHAVPFTKDGRMLLTGFRNALPLLAMEPHPDLAQFEARPETLAEAPLDLIRALHASGVSPLVGRFDSNYFHWLIDMCSQLEGVTAHSRATGELPIILIRSHAPAFVRDSLALLGIAHQHVVEWPVPPPWAKPSPRDMLATRVPRVLISAWRGYRYGTSGRSLRWLRSEFLAAKAKSGPDRLGVATGPREPRAPAKIYVQRISGGWRTIENEQNVSDLLRWHGFVSVRPEEHSLAEQMFLFSEASLIVGMHGAGLTNVLFAPRAHLVELVGRYGGPEYFSLCHGLGNPYTRVQCRTNGENLNVDLSTLEAALRTI